MRQDRGGQPIDEAALGVDHAAEEPFTEADAGCGSEQGDVVAAADAGEIAVGLDEGVVVVEANHFGKEFLPVVTMNGAEGAERRGEPGDSGGEAHDTDDTAAQAIGENPPELLGEVGFSTAFVDGEHRRRMTE